MKAELAADAEVSGATRATSHRARWRTVALPTEHGGWSLTAEPAVLGLLVAFSWPGVALAVGAMVAFVARTPIKWVLVDRWRHRSTERTRLALVIASVELGLLVALGGYAAVAATAAFWLPLVCAVPLIALELWYDMRSKSRRLIPELAGSVGIGAVATSVALADGAPERMAWGLWLVIAARSLAAIPYVRTQISRAKRHQHPRWLSDVAQCAAVAAVMFAAAADIAPVASMVAVAVIAALNIVSVRLAPRRAVVIGIEQTIHGIVVIAATAWAI